MEEAAEAVVDQTAEEDAAIEAALATGFGSEPAKAASETDQAGSAEIKQPVEEVRAAEPVKEPEPIVFKSDAEFAAAVAKAAGPLIERAHAENRKNFGQIGELNTALKDIRAKLAVSQTPAARKKLTSDFLKRTNEEFPGLGDSIAADLSDYLDGPGVAAEAVAAQAAAEAKGQNFDSEAFFASKLQPALAELEGRHNEKIALLLKQNAEAQMDIVYDKHPDFDREVKSPEFAAWLGTLPAERQNEIRTSERGRVAANAMSEFKAAQAKANTGKERSRNRLESALTPTGDKQPASHAQNDDEEAAMDKGFKSKN